MECLTSIFPWTFDKMVETVKHLLNYLVSYRDHVNKLYGPTVQLGATKKCIEQDIEAAERNLQNADADELRIWMDNAEATIAEAKAIIFEDQAKMTCCNGWCPDLIFRYHLSKNACQIESDLQKIYNGRPLRNNNVGYDGPTRGMVTALSTRGYEEFKSRKSVWEGVKGALKDTKITRIGVYGMAGSGKTMLVKRVAEQAEKDGLFDKVIVTVVSQTPNFKNIQDQIAQKFGRKHVGGYQDLIAEWLTKQLKAEKKILIIVDDIWKRSELDLNALGISFGNDQNGCKLLFTSRDQSVLKYDMNIEEKNTFLVDRLEDDEAKYLFHKIVSRESESENQKTMNKFVEECGVGRVSEDENQKTVDKLVEECGGLPLAITTVANALKKKRRIHWSGAVQRSKSMGMERQHDPMYSAIKLSYDFLESVEEQSLFLLCSLHAEDQEINIDNLLRYGVGYVQNDIYDVGLGMFQGVYKMEEARTRLNESIESLKDCFLLLDGNDGGTIKMHDVIRDVAIKIAKKKYMFIVKEALELEGRSKSKDVIAFSLPDGYDSELPERLICPQLKLFLLFNNKNSLRLPDRFFEETKELSVLSLNGMCLPLHDLSLEFLQNLQTLCLVGCKLDGVAVIGELKELKVLSFAWSNIERLPKEIGNLNRLQLLDLGNCSQLEVIEPDVLSNLKRLNELYIENSFNQWEVEGQNTVGRNARVSELDHLSHLTTLNIHIPNARILPNALCFKNLVRYKILIGENWDWTGVGSEISTLKINIDGRFLIDDGIKRVLKKCEALCLGEINGVKKILYKDCDGFPKLKYLDIKNNTEIQYIIGSGEHEPAFPFLESMSLRNMLKLEKIFDRDHAEGFSCYLRKVNVEGCESLKFVFHLPMIQSLSQLKEMVIHRCKEMDAVVVEGSEHKDDSKMEFTQLRILELRSLPKLISFSFDSDSESSHRPPLFNKKVAFPMLETLNIYQMDLLKVIWHDQLMLGSFRQLKKLYIKQCRSLIEIFRPNTLRSLQSLEELRISNCQLTEEVFATRGTNDEETGDTVQLKYLDLQNLPKLKYIWSLDRGAIFTFKNLHEVKVGDCDSLKSLFPASVARDLEQLSLLEIYQCGVEEIVEKDEELETMEPTFSFPQLTLLRLEQLPELQSFYPGKHRSKWPLLKELKICNCDKLKIFGSEDTSQQTPIFIEKHTFPNLEKLILEWDATLNGTYDGRFPIEFFGELRFLELNGAPFEEICRYVSEEEQHPGTLEHLTRLKLCKMPGLKHIWKENSQKSRSFKLQKLEILECDGLETFVPSSISFQNLTKLKVSKCQGLISLLTSSTAKSLLRLKKMKIFECEGMTDIVSNEGSEAGDEITFSQLKSLVLRCLRSLTSFNSGNCKIIFPSLEKLTVIECPQLKNFSNGVISAPMLKGVKLAAK